MDENKIRKIIAREILDSRGWPTVEVDVYTDLGRVRSSVPSGVSRGKHEAVEKRDGGSRFLGKGTMEAVKTVNEVIATRLEGISCHDQVRIDQDLLQLDGTEDKSKLGANAILAVSLSVCRAGALSYQLPLYEYIARLAGKEASLIPVPWFNVIGGGKHAGGELAFQEYHILPVAANSFGEALQMGTEVYYYLKILLQQRLGSQSINVGDEGAFAPTLKEAEKPLELIMLAIDEAGYSGTFKLGMDIAANSFFKYGDYQLEGRDLKTSELLEVYKRLVERYPFTHIEDPFAEDDWEGWSALTAALGDKIQIVGDDLTTTNVERIIQADEKKACNSVILKINQIGTVSETIEACKFARDKGMVVCVANRSGETNDTFIADLAVGLGSLQCKFGAPARGERVAKYNRLVRIEQRLGEKAKYAGEKFL